MGDLTFLFLAGLAAPLLVWSTARFFWTPGHAPRAAAVIWISIAAGAALAIVVALMVFANRLIGHSWTFVYWVTLGRGSAVLAGFITGLIVADFLSAAAWAAATKAASGAAIGSTTGDVIKSGIAGLWPAIAILLLFLLGVPGAREHLGLSTVKLGEVEVTLVAPAAQPQQGGFRNSSAAPNDPRDPRYSGYFLQMYQMTKAPDSRPGPEALRGSMANASFFNKEVRYFNIVDNLSMASEGDKIDPGLPGPLKMFHQQRQFLQTLEPVVRCAGLFHDSFPDVLTFRKLATVWLLRLAVIEIDLQQLSFHHNKALLLDGSAEASPWLGRLPEIRNDLQKQLKEFATESGNLIKTLRAMLPWTARSLSGNGPFRHTDCDVTDVAVFSVDRFTPEGESDSTNWTVVPPYIAMFLGNAYAALAAKDKGLEILNAWLRYYEAQKELAGGGLPRTKWFYDRALLQYGIIQEFGEAFPSGPSERHYLQYIRERLERDWPVDLARDGEHSPPPCAKPKIAADPEASARLFQLYSDIVQRWLGAVIATRSDKDGDRLDPGQYAIAENLLASADRCIDREDSDDREFRGTTARIAAGRFLARWAEDGPRLGFMRNSDAELTRMHALKALVDALPSIRHIADNAASKEGEIRLSIAPYDQVRRVVEDEIVDLNQKLTR